MLETLACLKNYFNAFWLTFDMCLVSTIMVVIRIGAQDFPTSLFIIRPHSHGSNSTPQKNRVLKLPNEQVSFRYTNIRLKQL